MHEPPAGPVSWDACSYPGAPVVATFHAYSTKPVLNHVATLAGMRRKLNQLSGRIAVSEAAAWTGRRWFGGNYEVIPNGVDVAAAPRGPKPPARRAAPGLRRASRGAQGPAGAADARSRLWSSTRTPRLVVVGAEPAEVRRYIADPASLERIEALGRVADDELWRRLGEADLLCAPSLAGESFGMVLTEAFAAGTPVLASQHRRLRRRRQRRPRRRARAARGPAAARRAAAGAEPLRPSDWPGWSIAARESAQRYAWPRVAAEVEGVYERARAVPRRHGPRATGSPAGSA